MFCPRYRERLEKAEHRSRKRSAGVRQAPASQKAGLGVLDLPTGTTLIQY